MKFKRSSYFSSPCWRAIGRWVYFDADFNTRWPFGVSMCLRVGPKHPWPDPDSVYRQARRGLTFDLNAPVGEPNRLYLWGARRQYMIGLVTWWTFQETGREGNVVQGKHVRCRPRLVRGQAWDWKRSQGTQPIVWRWLVIHPNDYRERWERAHIEEAEAMRQRRARIRAGHTPWAEVKAARERRAKEAARDEDNL